MHFIGNTRTAPSHDFTVKITGDNSRKRWNDDDREFKSFKGKLEADDNKLLSKKHKYLG